MYEKLARIIVFKTLVLKRGKTSDTVFVKIAVNISRKIKIFRRLKQKILAGNRDEY